MNTHTAPKLFRFTLVFSQAYRDLLVASAAAYNTTPEGRAEQLLREALDFDNYAEHEEETAS